MPFVSEDRAETVRMGDTSIDCRAGQNPECSERSMPGPRLLGSGSGESFRGVREKTMAYFLRCPFWFT